jgi:hypothetical protein
LGPKEVRLEIIEFLERKLTLKRQAIQLLEQEIRNHKADIAQLERDLMLHYELSESGKESQEGSR